MNSSRSFEKTTIPYCRKKSKSQESSKFAVQPRFHSTEGVRWDSRVKIAFKNAAIANEDFDASGIIEQLYPDQETYKKEE
jgi:hypothetical protein